MRLRRWRGCLGSAALLVVLGASLALAQTGGPGASSAPVVFAPHRAVYDIAIARASGGAGVTDMVGRMVYEITGSPCAGYTQTMRFVTRTTNHDGQISTSDLRSTSSEDPEQSKLTFSSAQYRDSQRGDQTAGVARRTDADIVVDLSQPRPRQLKLDRQTLFPIQHSMQLVAKARAGETSLEVDLYDGSEKGEKVYSTVSLIGKRRDDANKGLPKITGAERLDGMAAWPMTVSYYAAKTKSDAAPTYELSFLFFENGVSRRLLIDYGDFAIRGKLKAIEFLEPTPCPGAAAPKGVKK